MRDFRSIGATTFLAPVPAVLVGVADPARPERAGNLITVAWTGICCTKPPMLTLSLKPERYSCALLQNSGECTVNLVSRGMARACDLCGVRSGRDTDKFALTGLTPIAAEGVDAPAAAESPAVLSCRVRSVQPLGSHTLFLCEIVAVNVAERCFRPDGSIHMPAMDLCAYAHGQYFALGGTLGGFGFSVQKKKTAARKRQPDTAPRRENGGKPGKPEKKRSPHTSQ